MTKEEVINTLLSNGYTANSEIEYQKFDIIFTISDFILTKNKTFGTSYKEITLERFMYLINNDMEAYFGFKNQILIDYPGKEGFSHMVSDNIEFLHKFAEKIGINKCWYSNKRHKKSGKSKNQPHYDVKYDKLKAAVDGGAKLVDSEKIVEFLKKYYGE